MEHAAAPNPGARSRSCGVVGAASSAEDAEYSVIVSEATHSALLTPRQPSVSQKNSQWLRVCERIRNSVVDRTPAKYGLFNSPGEHHAFVWCELVLELKCFFRDLSPHLIVIGLWNNENPHCVLGVWVPNDQIGVILNCDFALLVAKACMSCRILAHPSRDRPDGHIAFPSLRP
jgi:hypothetical protein